MKKEYILCAAVREKNNPKKFHCGFRHNDVYDNYGHDLLGYDFYDDMGFLTSKGRFVGRKEAKIIATEAGQIIVDYAHKFDFLATEMIY